MRTVPLDVAPERRTKPCSPRFRPGGRFWNQGSRFNVLKQVISIYIHIYIKCAGSFFQVVRIRMPWCNGYPTTAHVLTKTLSPRLRTILQLILISILYVLARMVFF